MERRFYRSRTDRRIAGVCGGLAEYLDVDPTLVRVATVLLAALTQGAVFVAYVVMWVVVPEAPIVQGESIAPDAAQVPRPDVKEGGVAVVEDMPRPEGRKRKGAGFGVLLIALGCVLLINEMFPQIDVWHWWPVLIIIAGVVALVQGLKR